MSPTARILSADEERMVARLAGQFSATRTTSTIEGCRHDYAVRKLAAGDDDDRHRAAYLTGVVVADVAIARLRKSGALCRAACLVLLAISLAGGEGCSAGPGACYKYGTEAHVVAGAAVAYAVDRLVDRPPWQRAALAIGAATALGFLKEYVVDVHPSNREAIDWTLGASLVVVARWEF